MASAMRPSILRQAGLTAHMARAFSTRTSFPSSSFRTSASPCARPVQSAFTPFTCARIAAFHASSSKAILPPLPQRIEGTLNDPAPVPPTSPSHGSYHWSFERVVAAGLIPLTVAPFAAGTLSPITDALLISLVIVHSHIGFDACIVDYFPSHRVPVLRKVLNWVLRAATLLVAIGFYEFETNDVGVTEAVRRIWKAEPKPAGLLN